MDDVKAVPADFELGDWSERSEPLGPFCVWHGYFGDCPECEGSDVRWTVTLVQADPQALIVDESWSGSGPAQTEPSLPGAPMMVRRTTDRRLNRQQRDSGDVPVAPDHVPLRVNPGLLARIRLLLEEHT